MMYNNNKGHKIAVEQILHFLQTIKDPTKAINVRQKKSQSERLNKNRASLISIIAIVIFWVIRV